MSDLRVLVVGGYGVFGGRVVALLEDEPRLTLIVAGRSLRRAEEFIRARRPRARLEAAAFDRAANATAQLAELAPAVVVDASGPFQAYGYSLIEACIASRIHYLDIADGSDFVAGVGVLDARARAAGVFCLAGASSFPTLTAAVVRRLAQGLQSVETIRAGIAPLPSGGVGENVIRAIASYAGQRVSLRRNGVTGHAIAFAEQMRFAIAAPGRIPLHDRLFSLVDVPDLRLLAELWPEIDSVWLGAGPVPEIWHRTLIALAHVARLGLVRSLLPLAPLMHVMSSRFGWGERRGGMFVTVTGRTAAGDAVQRSWHLLAEGEDGPMIPAMAVEAVIRGLLVGTTPRPGARAAMRDVELVDYERMFARWRIYTGVRDDSEAVPLYARLLGNAWSELPAEIRSMHDLHSGLAARGTAAVERGAGFIARFIARVTGFPDSVDETP